ncbi:MAG: hypothetical protein HY064_17415 [Bacteroidetes bacterium]|nr:hypothetical protein [Bacteroidota bacterium]
MKKNKLITEKTARYFSLGELNSETKQVLFVLHGYSQLADEFLEKFSSLVKKELLIIAPEGLHRFYSKGHEKVVASWMTKEDRLDDIRDYVFFLDCVHDEVLGETEQEIKISVLGFSQGAATASRWAAMGKSGMDELILYCGFFPPDLSLEKIPDRTNVTIITASNDRYVSPGQEEKQVEEMKKLRPDLRHIRFEGEHEMDAEVVREILR